MSRRDGYVYFAVPVMGVPCPVVKIGWSHNPWANVHEGQRWTWFSLKVEATLSVPGSSPYGGTGFDSMERLLHDAFSSQQLQREWFRRDKQLEFFIELATALGDAPTRGELDDYASELIDMLDDEYERDMRRARLSA